MRDIGTDLDPTRASRDLGPETDLVVTIETGDGLTAALTAARFDPGSGYGAFAGESAGYSAFELAYEY